MSTENELDDVKSVQPPKTDSDGITIKAGEGMKSSDTPPSTDREQVNGEETPTNEVDPQPAGRLETVQESIQNASVEEEEKTDRSGKVIREIGEDRKALAEGYLELARKDAQSKQVVIEKIKQSPSLERYFKSKFGTDYESMLDAPVQKEQKLDEEAIRKEERIQVQAEQLEQKLNESRAKELEIFAQSLNFTNDELSELQKSAELLEGKEVSGKVLDYSEALSKAALLVNADKVSNKPRSSVSSVGQVAPNEPIQKGTPVTPELKRYASNIGRPAESIAKGIDTVKNGLSVDEDGKVVYRLSTED